MRAGDVLDRSRRRFLQLGIGAIAGTLSRGLFAEQIAEPSSRSAGAEPADAALWRLGAVELAAAIRRREVTCREVVEAHLERIRAVNGAVNAVTLVLAEQARRAAETADRELARGTAVGPLHGVPMTVKENVDLAGSATTQGIAALRDFVTGEDSPHIAQLRRAGAIPIGRTNLPDLGLRWHTDSSLRGATRNPWQASLTPGGSSGGDAAAVATGMTPLGIGNDYGGSLRYPAQCCGIAAIRPSTGRVPFFSASQHRHPLSLTFQLFAVQGPMARSVRDLRLALEQMSGRDARDPLWIPAPLSGPALQPQIRVALAVDPGGRGVDRDVAAGVRRAGRALSDAGYAVEEADPPAVLEAARLWNRLVTTEIRRTLQAQAPSLVGPDALAVLEDFLAANPAGDLDAYIAGLARRNAIRRLWSAFFERFPLIVGPVSTAQPFAVGRDLAGLDAVVEMLDSMRLVVAVSFLGCPAVTVPVGLTRGIPQAVQIIGPMFREDLCLDAGSAVEKALKTVTPMDPRSP